MVGAADVGAVAGGRVGRVVARDGVDLAGRALDHSYQASVRCCWSGSSSVAGCTRSPETTVWADGSVELSALGRAPISPSKNSVSGSDCAALPMPRKPPPSSMNASSAPSCSSSSRSPAVLRKTTALTPSSPSAVIVAGSSVASTVKPRSAPIASNAAMPGSVVGSCGPVEHQDLHRRLRLRRRAGEQREREREHAAGQQRAQRPPANAAPGR